jgi:3,4-dihydroxy 2-butanone 4-phosphate synthase / GTP cyclohydrolase II
VIQPRTYGTLVSLGERRLAIRTGEISLHRFQNFATRSLALAVTVGDVEAPEPILARVHSSCVTGEAYGGCDCDCAEQLEIALAEIARAGRGVIFYLLQEGRGAGFVAKVRDRMIVQASGQRLTTFEAYQQMGLGKDHRRYDEVDAICRLLGISAPLTLLTNNPEKAAALAAEGLRIEGIRSLDNEPSPFNLHYLTAKLRSGHSLAPGDSTQQAAELPESVVAFAPYALEEEPRMVHMASYLLPIRFAEHNGHAPSWFHVHAYYDVRSRREQVILTHQRRREVPPLVAMHRESFEDRLPLRRPSVGRRRWRSAVEQIVDWGAGAVLFRAAEDDGSPAANDAAALGLLVRHLGGRRARCLDPSDESLHQQLRDHEVAVEDS